MRVLKVLDQALEPRTFLVGESITLADMAVAMAVLLPFKYVRNGVCFTNCSDFQFVVLCSPEMLVLVSEPQRCDQQASYCFV